MELAPRGAQDRPLITFSRSGAHGSGPSERDLSIGNATMWHVNFAKLIGISGHVELRDEQKGLLDRLEVPRHGRRACDLASIKDRKVWDVLVEAFEQTKKQ